MDYETFQVAVVEIASEGVPLTVANVVARMRIDPGKAEKLLDRMARDNRLDLDVDETEGVVVYRVRGLTPRAKKKKSSVVEALLEGEVDGSSAVRMLLGRAEPDDAVTGTALAFGKPFGGRAAPLPRALRKSVATGVLAGGVVPGLGLAYAAPWPVVVGATLFVVVGFKLLAALTLFFAVPFLFAAAVGSAALGGVYTWRYNQSGRRAPLGGRPAERLAARPVKHLET